MFGLKPKRPAQPLAKEEMGFYRLGNQSVSYVIQRKSGKRRRISFYIEPPGRIRFIAPVWTSTTTIERIFKSRSDWIEEKLQAYSKGPPPVFPNEFKNGATISYLGTRCSLCITYNADQPQTCIPYDDLFIINLPHSPSTKVREDEARLETLLWYKKQARTVLKTRTDFWAEQLHLKYRRFAVTSPQRQWGSCSAQNDIRLNWRIMCAEPAIIDYLIVHELAHIPHKDHSQRFWNFVGTALPDYKILRKKLMQMDAGFKV